MRLESESVVLLQQVLDDAGDGKVVVDMFWNVLVNLWVFAMKVMCVLATNTFLQLAAK